MAPRSSRDIYAQTLAVFDQRDDPYEPLTTPEVTDELGANRRTVYKRLKKLVECGDLKTKKTGSNSRVWWRSPSDSTNSTTRSNAGNKRGFTSGQSSPEERTEREIAETEREARQSDKQRQARANSHEILEKIPDGVVLHDPNDGTIIDVNKQFCEMLGYTREEFLTLSFEAIHADVPPHTLDRAQQYLQRAKTEGPQTFEWLDETKDGEHLPVEVHLRRTTIGGEERILAVIRDITERKEREQELRETNRQLQAVLDTVEAMIFIKDTEGRYQLLNEECKERLGLDPDTEVVGLTDDDLFPDDLAEQYRADDQRVLERGETAEIEEQVPTPEGPQTYLTLKSPLFDSDGDPAGVCAVSTDITDRKERERELQVRSTAMETSIDGMAILDPSEEYVFVNQAHADVYGYDDPDAFLGETWRMCYDDDELARFENEIFPTLYQEGSWRGEAVGQRKDGTTFPQELSLTATDDGGIVCVVRDITGRKERERELRAARQFNEELVENAPFGMFRLDEDLRITYENPRAEEIIGLPDDKASSEAIGVDIRKLPSIIETGQADTFTRLTEGETIEFESPFESIYGKEAYFTGRGVPLYRDGEFDGAILIATDISERRQHERELERQREQLAALNELNNAVREITDTVIDQSTREEIEIAVCDRLAESESYQFAWICAADSSTRLEPRVEAGVDGYLDELPADLADPTSQSLIGKAVQTQEMQITQSIRDDPDFEPWHEHARQFGYRSAATIPIVYEDTLYGMIGVYSQRTDAFAEREREVIDQLGEVVGHAIASVERKRALMNDEIVELEVRMHDIEAIDLPDAGDGTVIFDRMVPIGDGSYLEYGVATDGMMGTVRALIDAESTPHSGPLNIIESTGDKTRFELRLTEPLFLSRIVAQGGYINEVRIEDQSYYIQIHLPPSTDVRTITDVVRDTYPAAEIVTRQQKTRSNATPQQIMQLLAERLTERQRAALEAGYFGGFFEWPRAGSGEDIAESLGIGASTFHQHVRKAEKKLLDVIFEESTV